MTSLDIFEQKFVSKFIIETIMKKIFNDLGVLCVVHHKSRFNSASSGIISLLYERFLFHTLSFSLMYFCNLYFEFQISYFDNIKTFRSFFVPIVSVDSFNDDYKLY